MLFEFTRPVVAGYFQCDLSKTLPTRDTSTQAALLYMSSGEGTWTIGEWQFPVRRGDMFGIPVGLRASAELNLARPLGYYYCYFQLADGTPPGTTLNWPWDLAIDPRYCREAPCASGPFRPEVAGIYRTLQYELSRNTPVSQLAAKAQLMLLGVNFGRMLSLSSVITLGQSGRKTVRSSRPRLAPNMPEPVARVIDFVSHRLDQELSLPELAKVALCSERHLVDLFRTSTGLSPMAFVRERRIREAKRLLMQGLPVKDIATRLSFADSHHFSRVFRQTTGISPTEYAQGKAPLRQRPSGEFSMAPPSATGTGAGE